MIQTLLDVILPVFLVIGFGYVAVWRGLFPVSGVDGVMKFAQNFAVPCLLFVALARLDLSSTFDWRLLVPFYAGAAICFVLGVVGARVFFGRDMEDAIAIGFCCLFSNSVLLGLPIMERAYGADAMAGNYAIVAMHAPFCYGLGIATMEVVRAQGASGIDMVRSVTRAMFRNALVLAILAGAFVNLSGLPLPGFLWDGLDLIVRAALPAALFALGGVLIQYRPEGSIPTVLMVCAIALVVHPAIVWVFGTAVGTAPDLFRSGVLTAAMAPGFNAYIFANMYGRARRVAATTVLIATGLSIFSVWAWLLALG
ncbi:MAG: AEC family transporter [Rhodobacteraceae bacterium]|nr:AEC family transporter [Paracoccaceae bacterium]